MKFNTNLFDINRAVAVAHVRSEQTKGWFLAQAKLFLVLLSGTMLFLGVFLLAIEGSFGVVFTIVAAVVAGILAISIEGGTILSASMLKEANRKIQQEISVLDRVRGKFTEEEAKKRENKIKRQRTIPWIMMGVCIGFSTCGAELFWHKILLNQAPFFQYIGYVLGLTCSALLIFFELKEDIVQRVIEGSISSSALIQLALDQSAKSRIHDQLFAADSKLLSSPEFMKIIAMASQERLYGVLQDAIAMAGVTVSAEQLQIQIEDEKESRTAAENFIASGGQDTEPLPIQKNIKMIKGGRNTDHRKTVQRAIKQYGPTRLKQDIEKYASQLGMSEKTLKRWLETETEAAQ